MSQIYTKSERVALRGLLLLAFTAGIVYLYLNFNSQLEPKKLVIRLVSDDAIYVAGWIICSLLLPYIFDFIIPKKEIVWCQITHENINFYPNSWSLNRKSFLRSEIDEIREVKETFIGSFSIYVFLKSGKYQRLDGYKLEEASKLLNDLKKEAPELQIWVINE
ncbi:MAG: hypothetical protein KDJ54_04405 [Candidatus Competibacteraceae bacterium]|nr:hypothetical protein [Candidatus Competibacteraceae bacterium]